MEATMYLANSNVPGYLLQIGAAIKKYVELLCATSHKAP